MVYLWKYLLQNRLSPRSNLQEELPQHISAIMLASSLLSFLAVASIAQGFPLEELDTSLAPRTTGETVTGPLHTTNGGGAGGSDSGTSVKSTSGGTGASQYNMYTGDGKSWPSQDQWIGDFVTMYEISPILKFHFNASLGLKITRKL